LGEARQDGRCRWTSASAGGGTAWITGAGAGEPEAGCQWAGVWRWWGGGARGAVGRGGPGVRNRHCHSRECGNPV